MHDFNKIDGEKIIYESDQSYLKRNDNVESVYSILTNFRLLIFINIENNIDYNIVLENSRGSLMDKKEVIFEINLDDIVMVKELDEKYDKYFLKSNNYFIFSNKSIFNLINNSKQ